jgi:cytochrome c-type biogenesis protein CcmH/NrfF
MRSLTTLAVLFIGFSGALAPGIPAQAQSGDSVEYQKAATTIRCDCGCHPQSVHDCACGRAAEMQREIHGLIAEGLDGDAVIAHYVDLQGEQIRLAPTATGFNLVAWLGPMIALLVASIAVVVLIRRWNRGGAEATKAAPAPLPSEHDPVYHDRLREAMERMK